MSATGTIAFVPFPFAEPTAAASDLAGYVTEQMRRCRRLLRNSVCLGQDENGVLEDLHTMAAECAEDNWDGYNAVAIRPETIAHARRFIDALPLGTSMPSVGAEPDGHVTLEWHRSARWTLSASVAPNGELHYAALLGARKAYGTEPFFGDVPATVRDLIAQVES
jgi:hypothetical protein